MAQLPISFFLICLGLIPSGVWLVLYLGKATHPEPRKLLAETFFLAILVAPLAIVAQWGFAHFLLQLAPSYNVGNSSIFFLWAAFAEEMLKFLVVFYLIIHRPDFDEPVDAMIYLITAALGFAAIENIIVLFKNIPDGFTITLQVFIMRFFGATLLHALSSALLGYFLALSWFYHHHSKKFLWTGIILATLFHFSFNSLLVNFTPLWGFFSSFGLLILMAILISILFTKIKARSSGRLSTVEL